MMWLMVLLVVLVLGAVAAVAAGRFGHLPDVESDLVPRGPGSGMIDAERLRTVRFSLAFRGYRMDEVDALLDRLAQQLKQVDETSERPAPD